MTPPKIATGVSSQAGAEPTYQDGKGERTVTTVNEIQAVVEVDTHVDTHTAVLCDGLGRKIAETTVSTAPQSHAALLA